MKDVIDLLVVFFVFLFVMALALAFFLAPGIFIGWLIWR